MLWLLSLLLAGPAATTHTMAPIHRPALLHPASWLSAQALLESDARRIRSQERRLVKLMADGARRSQTFADLVSRLHRTDVIVYVESTRQLPADTVGRILFQTLAGGQRYLRVQVQSSLQGDHIIAVLGHEFRHALEVADDAAVVDEAGLAALYRRIGHVSRGTHAYETDAARLTGFRVRDELIG